MNLAGRAKRGPPYHPLTVLAAFIRAGVIELAVAQKLRGISKSRIKSVT
jgi:hypothetical protein